MPAAAAAAVARMADRDRNVGRAGGAGDRADRQQQHGRRTAHCADRAGARSARLHAGGFRRGGSAACLRPDERCRIPRGVVPNYPGQFSALGFIMADARVDRHRTVQLNSRFFDRERATAAMTALVEEALAELAAQGYADNGISRSLEMRYLGQNYELEMPIDFDSVHDAEITRRYGSVPCQHKARFGFDSPGHIEIVNFLVTGIADTGRSSSCSANIERRPAVQSRSRRRPVCVRGGLVSRRLSSVVTRLRAGHRIAGPAHRGGKRVGDGARSGHDLAVDRYGNL